MYFNGVKVVGDKVELLRTASSRQLGAPKTIVQQAAWLKRDGPLELVFSYDFVSYDKDGARVKPRYEPLDMFKTHIGHVVRAADDRLKRVLHELVGIKQTQRVVDGLEGSTLTLSLDQFVARIRIEAGSLVAQRTHDTLVIQDVNLKLRYDAQSADGAQLPVGDCERQFLRYLQNSWIPKRCGKDSEFRKLKEVIVAQHIVNFARVPLERWEPKDRYTRPALLHAALFRHCDAEKRVWAHAQTATTEACAVMEFRASGKSKPLTVAIQKNRDATYRTRFLRTVWSESQLHCMQRVATISSIRPMCPDGGIVCPAQLPLWAPKPLLCSSAPIGVVSHERKQPLACPQAAKPLFCQAVAIGHPAPVVCAPTASARLWPVAPTGVVASHAERREPVANPVADWQSAQPANAAVARRVPNPVYRRLSFDPPSAVIPYAPPTGPPPFAHSQVPLTVAKKPRVMYLPNGAMATYSLEVTDHNALRIKVHDVETPANLHEVIAHFKREAVRHHVCDFELEVETVNERVRSMLHRKFPAITHDRYVVSLVGSNNFFRGTSAPPSQVFFSGMYSNGSKLSPSVFTKHIHRAPPRRSGFISASRHFHVAANPINHSPETFYVYKFTTQQPSIQTSNFQEAEHVFTRRILPHTIEGAWLIADGTAHYVENPHFVAESRREKNVPRGMPHSAPWSTHRIANYLHNGVHLVANVGMTLDWYNDCAKLVDEVFDGCAADILEEAVRIGGKWGVIFGGSARGALLATEMGAPLVANPIGAVIVPTVGAAVGAWVAVTGEEAFVRALFDDLRARSGTVRVFPLKLRGLEPLLRAKTQ